MRDQDEVPYIVIERHSAAVSAFIWGAIVGAGAALLLAPRSGEQTQEEIREGVRRVRSAAEDRVDAARTSVNRTRDRLETRIGSVREQLGTVRERLETRADEAKTAFDGTRRSAREALDRRVASTRDSFSTTARTSQQGANDGVDVVLTDPPAEHTEGGSDLG